MILTNLYRMILNYGNRDMGNYIQMNKKYTENGYINKIKN